MVERLSIVIDGQTIPTVTVGIDRSLDAIAASLRATMKLEHAAVVKPGATILAWVGQRTIFDGFVDSVSGHWSKDGGQLSVLARDRPAVLVDSTSEEIPSEWGGTTLLEVARDIARPFGLRVIDYAFASTLVLDSYASDPGEPAFAVLERAARRFGVLLRSGEFGEVILDRVGQRLSKGRIETGDAGRVISYAWRNDHSARFNRYIVVGQPRNAFDPTLLGSELQAPRSEAFDGGVRPGREKMILASDSVTIDECSRLAVWHASIAKARATNLQVRLQGWRPRDGEEPWELNTLVQVVLPEVGFKSQLLLSGVRLEQSEGGDVVLLRFVRPDSFQAEIQTGPEEGDEVEINRFEGLMR